MKSLTLLILIPLLLAMPALASTVKDQFALTLPNEPKTIDFASVKSSSGTTLLQLIHRTLVKIEKDQLVFDLAKKCQFDSPLILNCVLQEGQFWSDGSPIVAEDFINTFNYYKENPAFSEISVWLKNVKSLKSKPQQLIFELAEKDPLFIWKLTTPLFAPLKKTNSGSPFPKIEETHKFISSGFYQIKAFEKGKKILLTPNSFLPENQLRPDIILYFVTDDSVAFNLYLKKQIHFLRRLPAAQYPKYKSSPELVKTPTARFDYIGFGPKLKNLPELRKALALSADFNVWMKVLEAEGRPGCPALPENFYIKVPCYQNQERTLLNTNLNPPKTPLLFVYSKQGGEDHRRAMEWLQQQWQLLSKVKIKVTSLENSTFNEILKTQTPDIFRKGVTLQFPHCGEALDIFTSGSKDNLVGFQNPQFDATIEKLKVSTNLQEQQQLCQQATEILLASYQIIPLGHIVFHSLLSSRWEGVKINTVNQLDLSKLRKIR